MAAQKSFSGEWDLAHHALSFSRAISQGSSMLVGDRTAGNGGDAYAVPTAANGGSELLIFAPREGTRLSPEGA